MDVFKLNFDTFIVANGTSVAYIIHNNRDALLRAEGKMISQTNIPHAKLIAASDGIKLALFNMKIGDLSMEGDSSTVLTDNKKCQGPYHASFIVR